jgi:hypothetical protein
MKDRRDDGPRGKEKRTKKDRAKQKKFPRKKNWIVGELDQPNPNPNECITTPEVEISIYRSHMGCHMGWAI